MAVKFDKRRGDTPQESGRKFEKYWANLLGVAPVKGSGNQWHSKMDVGDGSILWSLKHTDAQSFRISKDLMRETERAINGPGGVGGSVIPGIATSLKGEVYVTLRAEDFLRIIASDAVQYVTPTRGEAKRARSKLPNILRENKDERK